MFFTLLYERSCILTYCFVDPDFRAGGSQQQGLVFALFRGEDERDSCVHSRVVREGREHILGL